MSSVWSWKEAKSALNSELVLNGHKTILDILDIDDVKKITVLLERHYGRYYKYRNIWRRILLFRETLQLASGGLGDRRISRILSGKYRYIPCWAVSDWIYRGMNPLGRHKIPVVTPGLGYDIGAGLGAGHPSISARYVAFQCLRDYDFAETLRNSIDGAWIGTDSATGFPDVYIANKMIVELIAAGRIDSSILLKILLFGEEVTKASVRGFFDAEGEVTDSVKAKNTNIEIIKCISTLLTHLGIHHTIHRNKQEVEFPSPNNGKLYEKKTNYILEICVRRCCLYRFNKLVGFSIQRKQNLLQTFVERTRFRQICTTQTTNHYAN